VFDEKYYASQAWQMLRNGGYEDNLGYEFTVHPPVGKHTGWHARHVAAGVPDAGPGGVAGHRPLRLALSHRAGGVSIACVGAIRFAADAVAIADGQTGTLRVRRSSGLLPEYLWRLE
jgi:hypothetical protein